jgi:peptidoglycan hydrolase-like protein with peptidoglycan-binding domain
MPGKSTKQPKKSSLVKRLQKLGRANLIIIGVFVLTFVGLGTFYVARSEAAGHDCVVRTYRYAPSNYYWCVQQAQRSLSDLSMWIPVRSPGYADGYFGGNTLSAVKSFQSYYNTQSSIKLTVDGVLGRNTWTSICLKLSQNKYNNYNLVNNQMYNDGCSLVGFY